MIVQCTSCQTKFRVPDEKIGDKAVKVRCSRCQTIFSVKRNADGSLETVSPGPAAPTAPAARPPSKPALAPAKDPFASFGAPPPVPISQATQPGIYHAGIAATRPAPAAPAPPAASLPAFSFDIEVTKPGVSARHVAATRLPDPPSVPPPPPPPPAADPFASLDLGPAAPPPPPAIATASSALGLDPFAPPPPLDDPFSGLALPTAAPRPAAPAADPFARLAVPAPATDDDPFANLAPPPPALPTTTPPPRAAAPLPAVPPDSDPFANLDLSPPAPAHAPAPVARPAPEPEPLEPITFSFESSSPAPASAAPAMPALPDPSLLGDPFAMAPEPSGRAPAPHLPDPMDPMTSLEPEHHDEGLPSEPDRSLFDLPPPPPPSAAAPVPAPSDPLAPAAFAPAPAAVVTRPRPMSASRPAVPKAPTSQRVLGAVLNVLFVIAVGWVSLLTYATARADWHFDPALLRPPELGRAIFGGKGAAAQLVLGDLSSGLYEVAGGRQVFFVRGELVNRGKAPVGPARAHVDVLDGDRVVAQMDAWAGKAVTPEQVYNLKDTTALKALQALQQTEALPIPPGGSQPFVALLLDLPEDLASRALRVTPDVSGATAAR